jgi:DNA polymerase V
MGVPYFQAMPIVKDYKVKVFSSNYTLYADLSNRVMQILESFCPEIAIYSIDEAFLDLRAFSGVNLSQYCRKISQCVLQYTGIPTAIGIGPSLTLAKAAQYVAKKILKVPVCALEDYPSQKKWLAHIPVGEVWGVGRAYSKRLLAMGIQTAWDLSQANMHLIRRKFSVVLARTVSELKGQPCLNFKELESKVVQHQIIKSRSFARPLYHLEHIEEALSHFCALAQNRLSSQGLQTKMLQVFVRSRLFNIQKPYAQAASGVLAFPSADIRVITRLAKRLLFNIYQEGVAYQKAGIILSDLYPSGQLQNHLWFQEQACDRAQSQQLMHTMAAVKSRYGKQAIHLAAEGTQSYWAQKDASPLAITAQRSASYTTSWKDLPKAG